MGEKTRILLFTGDGKGKTTAAMGMALRALGHGLHVAVFQFVKGDAATGELAALARFENARMVQVGLGFIPATGSPRFRAHADAARKGWAEAAAALGSGEWDMVLLDEINIAVSKGLLDETVVIAAVGNAAAGVVVLTGRNAPPTLIAVADTVTEMRSIKHGYDHGRLARIGVEY